jgi:hypothetical protein
MVLAGIGPGASVTDMAEIIQLPGTEREEDIRGSADIIEPAVIEPWPSPFWILGAILGWSL